MARALIQDVDELRKRLTPHLRRATMAILFGSAARGEADEWSDLDLLIVTKTDRPFLERFRDFEGIYEVWPRLDLLIYTPAEFAQMRTEGNALIERILAEGLPVHEAPTR